MFSVLLIAKSTPIAQSLSAYLELHYEVLHEHSSKRIVSLSHNFVPDAVVIEEDHDKGFIHHALDSLHSQNVNVPILIYSAQGNAEFIVSIMKKEVGDYLFKTKNFDQLKASIVHCIQCRFPARYAAENNDKGEGEGEVKELYGYSKQIREIKQFILVCASTNETVMLYGESGTGKTFIANLIHQYSSRSKFQIRTINCGAIPESLVESELFGSEVGAFTGAIKRTGTLARAHRGTLFLDELGDLPLFSQAKLLQMLDEKKYTPLGGEKEFAVNVRFISATNKNIRQMIKDKEFRMDLYYRMAVLWYTIPPLRERTADISYLGYMFLRLHRKKGFFTTRAMDKLMNHSWPGNIRELKNCVARASVVSGKNKIATRHIIFDL